MVDFLVPCKRFIELLFNRRNSPVDSPSAFIFLIVLNRALYVTEPVILQGEPDNFDVVLVQVEVVAEIIAAAADVAAAGLNTRPS